MFTQLLAFVGVAIVVQDAVALHDADHAEKEGFEPLPEAKFRAKSAFHAKSSPIVPESSPSVNPSSVTENEVFEPLPEEKFRAQSTLHEKSSPILHGFSPSFNLSSVSAKDERVTVHIIGDTHGDNNYLLRCLESTTRVVIDSTQDAYWLRWAPGMSQDEVWEIVILGDIVDRGTRSRENLLILKSLAEDPTWGKRLVVLVGNHESMMLESVPFYADGPEHWSHARRMEDLMAKEGTEGHSLVSWLRQRPAVYFSHGLLMMHGGLSKLHADHVAHDIQCQHDCGKGMQDFINNISHRFFEGLHEFYLSGSQNESEWQRVSTFPYILEAADSAKDGPGVLWYRGWSSVDHGAGSRLLCRQAEQVGKYLGDHPVMVVAHTTHPRITQYCQNAQVPIFAVDTHPSECTQDHRSECDFSFKHDRHPKYLETDYHRTQQLPQSLRVIKNGRHREFASCQDRNDAILCTTIRIDDFKEVPMHPVFVPKRVIEVPMRPIHSPLHIGKRNELGPESRPPPSQAMSSSQFAWA